MKLGCLLFAVISLSGAFLCSWIDDARIDDETAQNRLVLDLYAYAYDKGQMSTITYWERELQHQYFKNGGK